MSADDQPADAASDRPADAASDRPAVPTGADAPSDGAIGFPAYEVLRPVTSLAGVVLCDNPSEMTFEGTNTVVLRAPGSDTAVVVDPGPDDPAHAARVAEVAGDVELVLITHHHPDHTDGIDQLRDLVGAPVRAARERYCRGADPFDDDEVIHAAGLALRVVATPGHTSDSVSLEVRAAGAGADGSDPAADLDGSHPDGPGAPDCVVLGDTILGRDSTVLTADDGDLGDYLASMDLLSERADGVIGLPGHGPDVADVGLAARMLGQHRRDRLEQIIAARSELGRDADATAITEHIYRDVSPYLLKVAEQSTIVALRHLDRLDSAGTH